MGRVYSYPGEELMIDYGGWGRVYSYPGGDAGLTAEPAPTMINSGGWGRVYLYPGEELMIDYGGWGRVYSYPGGDAGLTAEPAPTMINSGGWGRVYSYPGGDAGLIMVGEGGFIHILVGMPGWLWWVRAGLFISWWGCRVDSRTRPYHD